MNLFSRIEGWFEQILFCSYSACMEERMLMISWIYLLSNLIISVWFAAPYGKFASSSQTPGIIIRLTSVQMPARIGWFFQEVPAFLVGLVGILHLVEIQEIYSALSLIPFTLHYFNRSVIFPLSIKQGRPTPVFTVIMAFLFCFWNGFMQSLFIIKRGPLISSSILGVGGFLVFIGGMYLNTQSDNILTNLRKPGETQYKIPHGGLFEYISAPNYLGEILEWIGWFMITLNPGSLWFMFFSATFLGSRALHTHSFYKIKFKEYPLNRSALIPGIL